MDAGIIRLRILLSSLVFALSPALHLDQLFSCRSAVISFCRVDGDLVSSPSVIEELVSRHRI